MISYPFRFRAFGVLAWLRRSVGRSLGFAYMLVAFANASPSFECAVARAQTASITLQRSKWLTAVSTNIVPLSYRFEASVLGTGLQKADLLTPTVSEALAGSTVQMSTSTNYAPATVTNSVTVSGLTLLNAAHPVGGYSLTSQVASTNFITKKVTLTTNTFAVNLTNDFPAIDPFITNVVPFSALGASPSFQWRPWTGSSSGAYASFYLFEGKFDTNTLLAVANGGSSALTNFTLVASYPKLATSQTSVQATNVNTTFDHLVLLEFHNPSENKSTFPLLQADSVSSCALLYFATTSLTNASNSTNTTLSIQTTSTNAVVVTWPTNSTSSGTLSSASTLPSRGKTIARDALRLGPDPDWARVTEPVTINEHGRFQVIVPTLLPRRFFRLEP